MVIAVPTITIKVSLSNHDKVIVIDLVSHITRPKDKGIVDLSDLTTHELSVRRHLASFSITSVRLRVNCTIMFTFFFISAPYPNRGHNPHVKLNSTTRSKPILKAAPSSLRCPSRDTHNRLIRSSTSSNVRYNTPEHFPKLNVKLLNAKNATSLLRVPF